MELERDDDAHTHNYHKCYDIYRTLPLNRPTKPVKFRENRAPSGSIENREGFSQSSIVVPSTYSRAAA
jgi:hypothetical protein